MAGRPARLRFRNAPHVTMTNVHNFTRTVRYNGDIEVDPAKLAVTGAVPTYLNYDWVLEDGAEIIAGKTMTVAGDINFVAPQTLEELVTFRQGLEIDTVGMTVDAGGIEATLNDVVATAGAIEAGTTVTAATNITATTGNIRAAAGNIVAGAAIQAGGNIQAGTDFNITAGGLLVSAGNINCHGQVEAVAGNIVASGAGNGAVEATAGSITAVTGNVTATTGGVAITGSGDLQVDAGNVTASANVTATAGAIEASNTVLPGGTITAGTSLQVVDTAGAPVTHAITGNAGGQLLYDGVTVTVAGVKPHILYNDYIDIAAAAGDVTIWSLALPNDNMCTIEGMINGLVTGVGGSADLNTRYTAKIFATWINVGGVLTALDLDVVPICDEITGGGSVIPAFTVDTNVADIRLRCANGTDGANNNEILWRGRFRVVTTSIA